MGLSEKQKQKQKKLAKKKQKRKTHTTTLNSNQFKTDKASSYANYPIHECLMPSNLFEIGIGNILFTRQTPNGDIAVSAFVVDVFCLGVKNAFFKVASKYEYEHTIKPRLIETHDGIEFEKTHPTCTRKLIEGAVQYAKNLDFNCHSDYKNTKNIFGDVDSSACPVRYIYGNEGKPYYIRGPNESIIEAKRIVDKLNKKIGEGGFEYMIMMEE